MDPAIDPHPMCESAAMPTLTTADGVTLSYSLDGPEDATPVVLVHGITESHGSWAPIVARLAPDHRVLALDLRGHGASGPGEAYGLEPMAGDVAAACADAGLADPHLVGHSLGGAVVSALGATGFGRSVVCVDQSLRLGAFQDALRSVEGMLRDPSTFPAVIGQMFDGFRGALDDAEWDRVQSVRQPVQEVVLGVWDAVLTSEREDLDATVDAALGGYADADTAYLALFGADPGVGEEEWLTARVPGAEVEVWEDLGHYPHLVRPDEFVTRLRTFWAAAA